MKKSELKELIREAVIYQMNSFLDNGDKSIVQSVQKMKARMLKYQKDVLQKKWGDPIIEDYDTELEILVEHLDNFLKNRIKLITKKRDYRRD
jgi:soluble cytochrome b562